MTTEPLETVAQSSELQWPPEDKGGGWESLDPWPRPVLAGVRIDGEYLCLEYRKPYTEGRAPLELAAADLKMLANFADLSSGDSVADGRLLRFSSQYGGLGLCKKHGWPFAHTRPHCASDSEPTADGKHYRERIRDWLFFSRLARAVVVAFMSKARHEREAALAELRAFIATSRGTPGAPTAGEPYRVILHWLQGGELKVWFRDRPPRLTLYGVPPLWTALGLELATFAVRAKRIILCSACGRLDSIKHPRGNGSRRSYCSKCRTKGRKRDAAADLRGRKKRTLHLRSQGKSVAEIVRELGLQPAQVKRYLAGEQ